MTEAGFTGSTVDAGMKASDMAGRDMDGRTLACFTGAWGDRGAAAFFGFAAAFGLAGAFLLAALRAGAFFLAAALRAGLRFAAAFFLAGAFLLLALRAFAGFFFTFFFIAI